MLGQIWRQLHLVRVNTVFHFVSQFFEEAAAQYYWILVSGHLYQSKYSSQLVFTTLLL